MGESCTSPQATALVSATLADLSRLPRTAIKPTGSQLREGDNMNTPTKAQMQRAHQQLAKALIKIIDDSFTEWQCGRPYQDRNAVCLDIAEALRLVIKQYRERMNGYLH